METVDLHFDNWVIPNTHSNLTFKLVQVKNVYCYSQSNKSYSPKNDSPKNDSPKNDSPKNDSPKNQSSCVLSRY